MVTMSPSERIPQRYLIRLGYGASARAKSLQSGGISFSQTEISSQEINFAAVIGLDLIN